MGSATAYHLARRGRTVLGLERFGIPHEMGSSHGLSRIIRLAYFEDPRYVPLLRRAYQLWRELEGQAGEKLLYITGSVEAGLPGSVVVEGSRLACETHDLPYEMLTAAQLMRRFPAFRLPPEVGAILQGEAGFLDPERCIAAHVAIAEAHGAEIHRNEAVLGWEPRGDGVRVTTARATYEAGRLMLAAGAWTGKLMPGLVHAAVPERQALAWLRPLRPELFALGKFPVFILDVEDGAYYGFPMYGIAGLKIGKHHHRHEVVDPDAFDRQPAAEDERLLRAFAERYFPEGAGPTLALKSCMYTNSPDECFIVDRLPECPQVAVAAGFSGHGFKFCSVIGEIMADLAESGATSHDIAMFRLARFDECPQ